MHATSQLPTQPTRVLVCVSPRLQVTMGTSVVIDDVTGIINRYVVGSSKAGGPGEGTCATGA